MPLAPGTWLNHYQILGHLGTGGMGEVYRALDNKLQREVALKVLPKAFAQDPERLARFRREAQVLAQLNHVNIAAIYTVEQSGETHFLVMELAPGETLRDRIKRSPDPSRAREQAVHPSRDRERAAHPSRDREGAGHPGPVPLEEALEISKQIAAGLECAHEKPIVHRDLKPANIKVTPEGVVKILDFGLARAFTGDTGSGDPADSPTLSAMTAPGTILGTAAYMSPEQARGKKVDKRTDIWALGCVLYELLTGQQAFDPSRARERAAHQSPERKRGGRREQGIGNREQSPERKRGVASPAEPPLPPGRGSDSDPNTIADIIGAVLYKEPDWTALPQTTPSSVRVLLRRCLEKDAKRRYSSAADLQIQIDEALTAPATAPPSVALPVPTRPVWRRALPSVLTGLVAAALAAAAVWTLKPAPPMPVTRTAIPLPPGDRLSTNLNFSSLALSPDGSQVAYVASRGGVQQIFLRAINSLEARPVSGTEGAFSPFFSPDGQWLGFAVGGTIKKVSIAGGAPLTLADTGLNSFRASWGSNDVIVFEPGPFSALWQVPATGGAPQPLTRLEEGEAEHSSPEVLPGGKAVLFTALGGNSQIVAQSLETGERKVLVNGGGNARYAQSGHLVYNQNGTLLAVPFDPNRLEVTGPPAPVLEGVAETPYGYGEFSVAKDGSLVYFPGTLLASASTLVWVDRTGAVQPTGARSGFYQDPRLSPDGQRIAVTVLDDSTNSDIWLYELARGTLTRLTFEPGEDETAVWTPDGRRLAFASNRSGTRKFLWKLADGSGPEEELFSLADHTHAGCWSPDGQVLAFEQQTIGTGSDIWFLSLTGDPAAGSGQGRKASPFLQTPFAEGAPAFSPDGRWLAYMSSESGRFEIYVQPYPGPGGKYQISTEGGTEPVWARNGRELFYRNREKMMVVDVTLQPTFSAGNPRVLFEGQFTHPTHFTANYDVSPDGQRFLMLQESEQAPAATQINVVLNWFDELKRRVPVR